MIHRRELWELRFSAQELLNNLDGVAYLVDARWRFVAFGSPNWRKFSDDNGGGAAVDEEALIGLPLTDFIHGQAVVSLWTSALTLVAQGKVASVVVPYRCDGPFVHRDLRMVVSGIKSEDGGRYYLFQSMTLNERIRPPVPIFDPRERLGQNLPLVAMCSFCHSLRSGAEDGLWQTPEAYYAGGGISQVDITHSVCPRCRGDWFRSLGLVADEVG